MYRLAAFAVALMVGFPMLPVAAAPAGEGGRAPAPAADHNGEISFADLAALSLANVTITRKGDAYLTVNGRYLLNEKTVSSAAYNQQHCDIACNNSGGYITVWADNRTNEPLNRDVYAQMIDTNGNKVGAEIPVATDTDWQNMPRVAANATGGFVIVWYDAIISGNHQISARRFDAAGKKLGLKINVTTSQMVNEYPAAVAVAKSGNFTVAWTESGNIYAQLFDPGGNKVGEQVVVCNAVNVQMWVEIAATSDGGYIVVWEDHRASPTTVYAQRLGPGLNRVGDEILVSTGAAGQYAPAVAVDPWDNFMVVVQQTDYEGGDNLYAYKFNETGARIGSKTTVCDAVNDQNDPQIAADPFGNFMISWLDFAPTFDTIHGLMIARNGSFIGGDIQVCPTQNWKLAGYVAADSSGNWMFTWNDNRSGRFDVFCRPCAHLHFGEGYLTTGDIAPPDLWSWTKAAGYFALEAFFVCRYGFNYSTDGAKTWHKAGADGSIASAGSNTPLRLRVTLSTTNLNCTTIVHFFNVTFIHNRLPVVTVPADQTAFRNSRVNLSASASDGDNDTLRYSWRQFSGPRVALEGENTTNVSFVANASGSVILKLSVYDAYGQVPGLVNITVKNRAPTVNPVPTLEVWKNDPVNLSANAADEDGDNLTVIWNQTFGNHTYLTGRTGRNCSFTATLPGLFTFSVEADDGELKSGAKTVTLTVKNRNPVAVLQSNASEVQTGEPVLLTAAGSSDPDGNLTGYNFRFGDGNESGWGSALTAVHAYGSAGHYSATVSVRDDDGGESSSSPVVIGVTTTAPPAKVPRLHILGPAPDQTFNTSNVTVTFRLENFTVAPAGEHIHFQLDSGTEVPWYSLRPYLLTNLTDGRHLLRAFLESAAHARLANSESSAEVPFSVSLPAGPGPGPGPVLRPDLALTESDLSVKPARPKAGESVTLSATIYNVGQNDSGAFAVKFYIDGNEVGEKTVVTLGKGANIVREVAWTAVAGNHTLRVLADGLGEVAEPDEANNSATVDFSVEGKSAPGPKPVAQAEFPWLLVAAVMIIVAVVAAMAVLMMRRRRPTTVIQYQPPPPAMVPPVLPAAPPPVPPIAQPPARPPAIPPPE